MPSVALSVLAPVSCELIWPPSAATAAVSCPFWIAPPYNVTLLIVCAVPARSRTPLELMSVLEAALNLPVPATVKTPVRTLVTPV